MKLLRSLRAASVLAAPLLILAALMFIPFGCGGGGGGFTPTPIPRQASLEVGFVDAPSALFQNLLLNVAAVRLNPDANATEASTGWVTVSVPAGVPNGTAATTSTSIAGGGFLGEGLFVIGAPRSELQIDLNLTQNQVQLFNIAHVPAETYHKIVLVLDPNIPGNVVPNCSKAPAPVTEGCISYGMNFVQASPSPLAVVTPLPVAKGGLTTLVIDFNPGVPSPPTSNTGPYTFSPSISVVPNKASGVNELMGLVSGTVSGSVAAQEKVTAELSGTSTVVASALVVDHNFSFQLPASPSGTDDDVYAWGTDTSYDVASAVPVSQGAISTQSFSVTTKFTGSVTGTISDSCTKAVLPGATLAILESASSKNCSLSPTPSDCVVVATAATDERGVYPMPGNLAAEPPFNSVPVASNGTYALRISASGYQTITTPLDVTSSGTVTCPDSPDGKSCSFALSSAYIKGTIQLGSPVPPGTAANIQVFAEEAGTNNLVSALPAPLSVPCSTAPCTVPFTLNVPSAGNYDLYATTIDLFQGSPDPFTGHTMTVASNVAASAVCPAPKTPSVALGPLECAGHGSVTGAAAFPFDEGTTVRLSKNGVDLMESGIGPSGTSNSGQFSFCAPADTYTLSRYENGLPDPSSSPTTVVLLPPPLQTSPCPTTCSNSSGSCPGNCSNTALANPL